MHKFGLKIWSTNENYVSEALRLFDLGLYDYIELYVVPDSFGFGAMWKKVNVPYVIHAPHSVGGLNPGKKDEREKNILLTKEVKKYADLLNAGVIIFHPGINGDIDETISQFRSFDDSRMVVENKPYWGIDGVTVCNGYSPQEIKKIIDSTGIGFCFDIGHAICAANALKLEPFAFLRDFLKLSPKMYHLSDGDFTGMIDKHYHFGSGSFPIKTILEMLPPDCSISIETVKDRKDRLDDFVADVNYLRKTI